MKKTSIKAISTFIIALLIMSTYSFPGMSGSIGRYGNTVYAAAVSSTPDLNNIAYNSQNIFYPNFKGQCTWFTWGRALEKLGIKLSSQFQGNAGTWWNQTKYQSGSEPRENSIAVWVGGSSGCGHVAFVERVDGNTVYFNEANFHKTKNYDGALESLTKDQMKQRGSLYLKGYIYLTNTPSTGSAANRALTVKGGPADSYVDIGSVSAGEAVTILDKEGVWYHIEYNTAGGKKRGYAYSGYINTTQSVTTADYSKSMKSGCASKALTVKGGPGDNYIDIGSVGNNETLTVLTQEGSWYLIEYNTSGGKKRGYVSTSYINTIVNVTGISLSKVSDTLTVGGTDTLAATIAPANASNKNITWTSSNAKVVTVNNGVITAVSTGNTTITVTTVDGSKSATCAVTVNNKTTTLNLTAAHTNLYKAASFDTPLNDSNGKQGSLSPQPVTVIKQNGDWYNIKTWLGDAWINIKNPTGMINVTGISLNKTSDTLTVRGTDTLVATITPSNATNKNVTWISSNPNVAKVVNGVITAVGSGSANITATTVDGSKSAICVVTVNDKTTTLNLTAAHTNLYKAASFDTPLNDSNGKQGSLSPQPVTVIKQNGDWYNIKTWLGDAWINIKYPVGIQAQPQSVVVKGRLDVYGGPSSSYANIGWVENETVTVLSQEGTYYFIEYNTANGKKRGYIVSNGVTVSLPVPMSSYSNKQSAYSNADLNVIGGPGSNFVAIGSIGYLESITKLNQEGDWYFIEYNTVKGNKRGYVKVSDITIGTPPNTGVTTDTTPIVDTSSNQAINALLNVARAEIGTIATGTNGNDTEYGQWFKMNGVPWCSIFVSWVADKSNNANIIPKTASCSEGVAYFKSRGQFGNVPKVGAIVYFGAGGGTHVGIVESVNNDGKITTIEGNVPVNGCWKVDRLTFYPNRRGVYGYGYPNYPNSSTTQPPSGGSTSVTVPLNGYKASFSYPNNAVVQGASFAVRDQNGKILTGRSVDNGDKITVLNVDYTTQLVLVEYPTAKGIRTGYIKNDTSHIIYYNQDKWQNGSTSEEVLNEDRTHLGWLNPYEKATILYQKNGMTYVVYNTNKGVNTKSGYVVYSGTSGNTGNGQGAGNTGTGTTLSIDSSTWGKSVTKDQLIYLSEGDLVARTLYGEAIDSYNGIYSVAWSMINRETLFVQGNSYYNKSYKKIVTAPHQYTGLTGSNSNYSEGQGRNPNTNSSKWKKCVEVAKIIVQYQGDRNSLAKFITNRIDRRRYYLSSDYFKSHASRQAVNPITVGDNTFFHLSDEGY